MKLLKCIFHSVVLLFLVASCSGSRQEVSEESEFVQYINAYTSGLVSKYTPIRIMLANEIPGAEAGGVVPEGVFEFSPKIKGNLFWVDNRTIEFKPDEPLKNNQEYIVKFHLSKFQKVDKNLETFVFKFKTLKQAMSVKMNYPVISALGEMTLQGRLLLTDKDELEKIRKTVSLKFSGKENPQIEWQELKRGDSGYFCDFSVLGIEQKREEQELLVTWNGSSIAADTKGEESVAIPSNTGLELIGYEIQNGEDAHIQLYFNVALQAKQDFASLCYFSEDMNVTFIQEGSLLKIYPSKVFFEEKELILNSNLRGVNGSLLDFSNNLSIRFESLKPAVRLINKGVILPESKGLIIPFQAVNLRAVDVYILKIFESNVFQFLQVNRFDGENEMKRVARPVLKKTINLDDDKLIDLSAWHTFSLDLSDLIKQEPGAIYRVVFRMKKSYSVYPCRGYEEEFADTESDAKDLEEWDKTDYYSYYYDYDYYYYDDDGDYWENLNNPCHPSYYTQKSRSIETNVLASNFGIVAKSGENNKFFAAVTNLLTVKPESDAHVLFYNYQQQLIGSAKTDNNGFVEFSLDKKPYFLEVEKGGQKGYLRLDDGSSLSLSNFDVSGEQYQKGLKGYTYGERGVWRPGDTLHITFILQDEDKVLPEDHPIVMEFKNPRNQLYTRLIQKHNETGFYTFHIPTTNDVPTGQWNMKIQVGGSIFNQSFWIETVKPNRLKITLDLNMDLIRAGSVPRFILQSAWLHGGTASNKEADVKVKYRRTKTNFAGFNNYIFESPISNEFTSEEKILFDGKTDVDGNAVFTKEMPVANNAPGMLQADFTTRVFEGEGDFSVNYKTVNYSPYRSYVGLRVPKAQNPQGILYTNKKHDFEIAVVDENGKASNSNIQFVMYKLDWRWWWDSGRDNDLAYYINNSYAKEYFTRNYISTSGGKASVSVEVPNSDWGRYLVIVKDNNSGHLSGTIVYFDWEDWLGRSGKENPNGATMLTFTTDKDEYTVGDKVKVTIPSSPQGRALVTVENRSRVISAQWVETEGNNSSFEVEVTSEMAPNAYIYVTFLQPHANTGNDLPIRLYGVKNIMVADRASYLYPVIKMPESVEPEKEFSIKVSEENGKDMTYTLAIVDEGLLDLTNFKTPDPHAYFYRREALGVKTWDMFDYVIGAYGGKIEQLFGIGGDMSLKNPDEDKTNSRFKPVVKFIGPCVLKAGKTNEHKITLPSYFGSVRTMVVAGNNNYAYGNTEKTTKVQKPLMVLATLPRVAGLNEDISLPVQVFAMNDNLKNVTVSVSSGNLLKITGENTQQITFDKAGDKVLTFKLKAANYIGKEKIKVKAVSGSSQAEYEVELEVRNPNPRSTQTTTFTLEAGDKKEWNYKPDGMAGTNTLALEVARIPSLNLESRLEYLIGYPHGCSEQTTSKGFPQLFLSSFMSLSAKEAEECEQNVKSTILKLTQMQRSDGAVLYWMGGNYTYDWVTSYAGHFMLEAKDKGYAVPAAFLSSWADYQKQKSQAWSNTRDRQDYKKYNLDDLEQAYRLYTLALYGKPEIGAMNRLRETPGISVSAIWRLAAAYILTGKPEIAQNLIANLPAEVADYSAFNNTFGSSLRDNAMILETLVLLKENEKALKQAQLISKQLNKNSWYSTQAIAYSLVGMSKFAGLLKADKDIRIAYTQNGKQSKKESKDPLFKVPLSTTEGVVLIQNEGDGTVFVNITQSGIPLEDNTPAGSNGLTMTVQYTDMSGNPLDIGSLRQGTDFLANVSVQNTSSYEEYNEMSLIQIFPSGWEIWNDRMQNGTSPAMSPFNYQDIRDDRVFTYFNLKPLERKSITIQLNAAYAGRFFLPATLCEAMYDNKVYARNQGRWVEVVK